jgi:hypothetical protein
LAEITPYHPIAADSITAIFVCVRCYDKEFFYQNAYYYFDAAIPLRFDSLVKRPANKITPNMIQVAPGDSNDITITYPKGNYVLHSTRGFSSIILDHFPWQVGGYFPNYPVYNYKIHYSSANQNTDKILSNGNGEIGLNETNANLKPYSCSSNKFCYFSICFDNYSYFKVNGKWFVWINRVSDYSEVNVL